jgi:hypothetical protein
MLHTKLCLANALVHEKLIMYGFEVRFIKYRYNISII